MECPNCGDTTSVVVTDSRKALGSVRRRRLCGKCRTTFYTWEITEKELSVRSIMRTIERLTSRKNNIYSATPR